LTEEKGFSDQIKRDSSTIILSYQTNYNLNFMLNSFPNSCSLLEINNPWGNLAAKYILSKKISFVGNELYLSAFSSSREINKEDIDKFKLVFENETKFKLKGISLINYKVIYNNKQPDWAFSEIDNFNFNSYYYYLYKVVF